MNQDKPSSLSQLESNRLPSSNPTTSIADLEEIAAKIHSEQLHHEIQQGHFQSALPNNRQALYALLRNIEENGGWPYVQRWKLQELFANLPEIEK